MSYLLYRCLTQLACFIARPYLAVRSLSGGREWSERAGRLPIVPAGFVWVHAASVGEVAAALPLVRALADGGASVLLSVVTRSGRAAGELAAAGRAAVSFAPVDCVGAIRSVCAVRRPRALLLIETELWPNLIVEAEGSGVPVGIVNARLSEANMSRYLLPCLPFREVSRHLSLVACRTPADLERYRRLGVPRERLVVGGNMKFDTLDGPLDHEARARVRDALGVPQEVRVVVFGSVRPKEEAAVCRAAKRILDSGDDVCVVIAPRHLKRVGPLLSALSSEQVACVRRSSLDRSAVREARAILLDTTGELSEVYGIASVSFVGGSLADYGGHNPLEPAARGVPVLFGPHTESCRESSEMLIEGGGAAVVRDSRELAERVVRILGSPDGMESMGAMALATIESGRGATARTMSLLEEFGLIDVRGAGGA